MQQNIHTEIYVELDQKQIPNTPSSSNPQKKTYTKVWDFFEKTETDYRCLIENCTNTFSNAASTSSLNNHLFEKHSIVSLIDKDKTKCDINLDIINEDQYPDEEGYLSSSYSYQKRVDKLLLEFIINDLQDFEITNSESFLNFVHELDPSYVIPDSSTLKANAKEQYTIKKHIIKDILKTCSKVNLTCSIWHAYNMEPNFVITSHTINSEFKPISMLLDISPLNNQDESIFYKFNRVLNDFELKDSLLSITENESLYLKNLINWYPNSTILNCAVDTIDSIVNYGLENADVSTAIEKLRYSCKRVHGFNKLNENSSLYNTDIEGYDLNKKFGWKAIHDMINTSLKLNKTLKGISSKLVLGKDTTFEAVSERDWEVASLFVYFLEPFDQATKDLSADCFGVVSQLYTIFEYLGKHLKKCLFDCKYKFMKKSIEYMLVKYDEYWEAIKDTALICQIIDPRYKNFNLDSTMKTKGAKKLNELFKKYSEEINSKPKEIKETKKNLTLAERLMKSRRVSIIEKVQAGIANVDSLANDEVSIYLKLPPISLENNDSQEIGQKSNKLLNWWKENSDHFPVLSKIARDYLTIMPIAVTLDKSSWLIESDMNKIRSNLTLSDTAKEVLCQVSWNKVLKENNISLI